MGSMTAELDYAFLAEYAKTEAGTITAIGASFTEVRVRTFPAVMDIAVAGRIRRKVEDEPPTLKIEFTGVDGAHLIAVEDVLEVPDDSVEYAGKTASVFAYRGPIPLDSAGLYWCNIYLDGGLVRQLAFTVEA